MVNAESLHASGGPLKKPHLAEVRLPLPQLGRRPLVHQIVLSWAGRLVLRAAPLPQVYIPVGPPGLLHLLIFGYGVEGIICDRIVACRAQSGDCALRPFESLSRMFFLVELVVLPIRADMGD